MHFNILLTYSGQNDKFIVVARGSIPLLTLIAILAVGLIAMKDKFLFLSCFRGYLIVSAYFVLEGGAYQLSRRIKLTKKFVIAKSE